MAYYKQAEFVRLAMDQGFAVTELAGGTGVRIHAKDGSPRSHCVYTGSSHSRAFENTKAALKRLGIKFPEDENRKKAQVCEFKQPTEARSEMMEPKKITPVQVAASSLPPMDAAKKAISDAMNALAALEQALTRIEDESKKFQVLKDAMRALGS